MKRRGKVVASKTDKYHAEMQHWIKVLSNCIKVYDYCEVFQQKYFVYKENVDI